MEGEEGGGALSPHFFGPLFLEFLDSPQPARYIYIVGLNIATITIVVDKHGLISATLV